ncbi:hypothetical protein GYH30_044847 [Glycine max]|uniref:Uncharacterized protein n=1 Tax=Glycine soja TaxID=3848 RepID=A0A445GHC7_GLYSO|nr:hypothetical protein GYH30_044847 [Glycine max]RZB60649.1 hypothetical protein D0Y65_043416 [Glycine soja]
MRVEEKLRFRVVQASPIKTCHISMTEWENTCFRRRFLKTDVEKSEVKIFHNKSIDHSLDELWSQPFKDNYVTGENIIAPIMDPNVDEVVECDNVDGEEGDKEIGRKDTHYESDGDVVYWKYNQCTSQVEDLFNEEHTFLPNFMLESSST